jgi:hypothetical protein
MEGSKMAVNDQYRPGQTPFGMSDAIADSGAPGTPGITAAQFAGGVVGTPVVSVPYASSQLAESRPTVGVMAGDTCSLSSDAPVPPGGDPLTGLSLAQVAETGAGSGTVITPHHPGARS